MALVLRPNRWASGSASRVRLSGLASLSVWRFRRSVSRSAIPPCTCGEPSLDSRVFQTRRGRRGDPGSYQEVVMTRSRFSSLGHRARRGRFYFAIPYLRCFRGSVAEPGPASKRPSCEGCNPDADGHDNRRCGPLAERASPTPGWAEAGPNGGRGRSRIQERATRRVTTHIEAGIATMAIPSGLRRPGWREASRIWVRSRPIRSIASRTTDPARLRCPTAFKATTLVSEL